MRPLGRIRSWFSTVIVANGMVIVDGYPIIPRRANSPTAIFYRNSVMNSYRIETPREMAKAIRHECWERFRIDFSIRRLIKLPLYRVAVADWQV